MRPDLQDRFIKVAHNLDRLEHIRNIVDDKDQVSPRSLIASAAVAGAEFLAAANGHAGNVALIHRAYEEIFAALENSEAVNEMILENKVASVDRPSLCGPALSHLQAFRVSLASMGDENA